MLLGSGPDPAGMPKLCVQMSRLRGPDPARMAQSGKRPVPPPPEAPSITPGNTSSVDIESGEMVALEESAWRGLENRPAREALSSLSIAPIWVHSALMDAEITPTADGPLHAQNIRALKNDRGETIDSGEFIFLRRCGASKNKPYCDGSHGAAGFSGKRLRTGGSPPSEFVGKEITVVDDFSLCAHAGACVDGAPGTFFSKEAGRRVSHPDASPTEQVIATIKP